MKRKNPKLFKKGRNGKIGRFNGEKNVVNNLPSREDDSDKNLSMASEDDSEINDEEEVLICREPTTYDDLLKKLGSASELVANALKRRKLEEEGKSDSEDDGSKSFDSHNNENNASDNEPFDNVKNGRAGSSLVGSSENVQSSVADDEDDEIAGSDTDEEGDSRENAQSIAESSLNSSTFSSHVGYKLTPKDIENLMRRKWSYKWEVPALGMSNCKWKGTGKCFIKAHEMNLCDKLKGRLLKHWLDIYREAGGTDFDSSKQRLFFSICNSYRDVLHHNKKPYYLKGLEDDSAVMDAYIMHSLNHIFRTKDLVSKNDSKIANSQASSTDDMVNGNSLLDRGFTRPKILILLPLASIAFRVVKRLIQLTPPKHKVSVDYIDRFSEEFGTGGIEELEEGDVENLKNKKPSKPLDFQALFGGNNNDHFMIGIKYLGKRIRLYGDFYSSDIIVASPLGLITKIGEAEAEKEKDVDYLSSIEVLIIDHADVILMQNWSHVNTVVEHLNRMPSKGHGTDIMRIRPWYLDGQAQFYRQTIILGSHLNPDINALFNQHCLNYQGKVRLAYDFKGVLPKIMLPVRQVYERFDSKSISEAEDARFEYFCKKIFPKIKDSMKGGIMIFVSSYFEFVRLRNFLKSQEASFCLLGEYTKQSDISRARIWFFQGQRKIMLYTERAHFYHRYKIRAIQNLIIFSLPERKEFYPEIVNMLDGSNDMTCTVLFSHFDQFRLERIVGSTHAKRMVQSEKSIFIFC